LGHDKPSNNPGDLPSVTTTITTTMVGVVLVGQTTKAQFMEEIPTGVTTTTVIFIIIIKFRPQGIMVIASAIIIIIMVAEDIIINITIRVHRDSTMGTTTTTEPSLKPQVAKIIIFIHNLFSLYYCMSWVRLKISSCSQPKPTRVCMGMNLSFSTTSIYIFFSCLANKVHINVYYIIAKTTHTF
jgi:hypothetical protein